MKRIDNVVSKINELAIDASSEIAMRFIGLSAKCMARHWQRNAKPEKIIDRVIHEFVNSPAEYGYNDEYRIITDESEANSILRNRIPTLDMIFHTPARDPLQHTKYYVTHSDEESKVEYAIPVVYRAGPGGKGIAIMAFATRGNTGISNIPDDSESINLIPSDTLTDYLIHIAKIKFCNSYEYAVSKSAEEYYNNVDYVVEDSWSIPNPDAKPMTIEDFKGLDGARSLLKFMKQHDLIEGTDDKMHVVGLDNYVFNVDTFKNMLESDHDFRNVVYGIAEPFLKAATKTAESTEEESADSNDVEASAPESYFNSEENNE